MKELIKSDLRERIFEEITSKSPLAYLRKYDEELYLDEALSVLYLYTRKTKGDHPRYFVEIATAIGHRIRKKLKQPMKSALAVKTGAFFLYTIQKVGIVEVILGQSRKRHAAYLVKVVSEDLLYDLWKGIQIERTEKLPSLIPYAPWVTSIHPTGAPMVKTNDEDVLRSLTPETHPVIFNTLNKSQETGWMINEKILAVQQWALRNKAAAFDDIWNQTDAESKRSKHREARDILGIAERFTGEVFYHLYNFDFRGRKYVSTAFLHEQGPDISKGLLLRADSKRIGEQGLFWLLISLANNWAGPSGIEGIKTDKMHLADRAIWAWDNHEILLSYAESPKVNQGWMAADKPWQFLAACFELAKVDEHGIDYKSHLSAFIDGSTNGAQHLTALTRDELSAPYVNLTKTDLPGDLYAFVGDQTWKYLRERAAEYTEEEVEEINEFIDKLQGMKASGESREEIHKFKIDNYLALQLSAPLFWLRVTDKKEMRKIVKRNVMTIPYGGTPYGLGTQQMEDSKKHGIEKLRGMENIWAAYIGRAVYASFENELLRPMKLLKIFEQAGTQAEENLEFLRWTVPITGFPVVQHYVEGTPKKTWVQFGPKVGPKRKTGYHDNAMQLSVLFLELKQYSKGKQAQGAAPNIVHSLDAAHLMLIADRCDFRVTTVHDSFGALLADMPALYTITRSTFVELYKDNPLFSILENIGMSEASIDMGELDITEVLESEYAFS